MAGRGLFKVLLISGFGFWLCSAGADEAASKAKKGLDAKIYEADRAEGITAKVKTFKASRGDTLVYFEGLKKAGPYILSETIKDYTLLKNRLATSAAVNGPQVSVTIDEQDYIKDVTLMEPTAKTPGKPGP